MIKYYVGILPTWLVVQIYCQQPTTLQVPALTDIWENTKKPESSSRWANSFCDRTKLASTLLLRVGANMEVPYS